MFEELHHSRVFPEEVRDVKRHRRTLQRFGSPRRECVRRGIGRCGNCFVPVLGATW